MTIKVKDSDKIVQLCEKGLRLLTERNLLEGWRLHSAGYAVYQYMKDGKIETLYMHKLIAEHFVEKPQSFKKLFVHIINGDKLDCRVANLDWVSMSDLRRQQNRNFGYRGVSKDGKKYRAVLYDSGERIYLGLFDTAEEAAKAYNEESIKRFGSTKSLNIIK
jgi:hypothetical protein